ncbi:class I SAM-dependent methyltransferase [Aliiroseovarius sp.]|uniref:class I SAM-dependent methyltransferase n=1 Tax=Aliiroseovarius sp. TaxID=1872442 RepID=UPI00261C0426|nr:class I SAM-dependent methyltransferase [Aliiroseovarius sp.]
MWDEKYATEEYVYGTEPTGFLRARAEYLIPGARALAVADGEGRNSVYLAQQGLNVTAMDGSTVALDKARRLAAARDVEVGYHHGDITCWDWRPDAYDLVVAVFIQFLDPAARAKVFEGMKRTLAPGGVLLLHGYRPEQLDYATGGPPNADFMYTEQLLTSSFADLEILRLKGYDTEIHEGTGHAGMSALIDLVARKPA